MQKFNNVKSRLMEIQQNRTEQDLFPVLQQLLVAKEYDDVEITHGPNEYGKDLVFSEFDTKLGEKEWLAMVVKNKNADMKAFEEGGEILRQVKLAFDYPYTNNKGEDIYINKVIVVVNGTISNQAKNVMQKTLQPNQRNNIFIWNYQKLETEIEENIKDLFLSGETGSQVDFILSTYRKNLEEKLVKLDNAQELFSGLSITQINDIFVNVRVANQKYENEKKRYQDTPKIKNKDDVEDSISIINSNKNTIIRGVPTSGKTLLLKRIGLNALNQYKDIGVFWFRFRDIDINTFNLAIEIKKQFAELTGEHEFKQEYFKKILFLFDALDEIISDSHRIEIITKLQQSVTAFENAYIIITGRNIELFNNHNIFDLTTFDIVDLLPFDVGQAFQLVQKIIPNNKDKSNHFIEAIKNSQLSNSLTRTPMALTLMAIMYKDDAIDMTELPANITELYSKFSDYYLDKWDATKGISSQYKYEEFKHILGFIAYHLHVNNLYEISSNDLKTYLQTVYQSHSTFEELNNVAQYIENIKERNTLLYYDRERDMFTFNSISFQEYFSSVFFDDSNEQELIDNLYLDWWQNVIIFYNGKNPKRSVFIEKILKNTPLNNMARFSHMYILSKCLQAAHLISDDVENNAIKNIIYVFDQFYKSVVEVVETSKQSIAYEWTTLDMILQCRNILSDLFTSKHIKVSLIEKCVYDILSNKVDEFSDVTLYCLSYYLAYKTRDAIYFDLFLDIPHLNTRWDRIVYKDIVYLKLKNDISESKYNRIRRKQKHNKIYIDQQFKEPAILHLQDGVKLKNK